MLVRGSSSAAFLLRRHEKGVTWPIPCRTHPARLAVVALVVTCLVDICSKCRAGRAKWRHLSTKAPHAVTEIKWFSISQESIFWKVVFYSFRLSQFAFCPFFHVELSAFSALVLAFQVWAPDRCPQILELRMRSIIWNWLPKEKNLFNVLAGSSLRRYCSS